MSVCSKRYNKEKKLILNIYLREIPLDTTAGMKMNHMLEKTANFYNNQGIYYADWIRGSIQHLFTSLWIVIKSLQCQNIHSN